MPALPDINEIMDKVDLEQTLDAMANEKIRDYDLRDARALVLRACETWLPRDVVEFEVDGIEGRIKEEYRSWEIKGYMDMNGTFRGAIPVLQPYAGKRFTVDWKTTKNRFTTEWKTRLLDSWQWKLYTTFSPAEVFIFRGINRYGECKEVMMEVPQWQVNGVRVAEYETKLQLDNLITQFEGLMGKTGPWLRNMPSSCYAFKKQCPYYENSCEAAVFPEWGITADKKPRISYSLMNNYLLCPERLRRELHSREVFPDAVTDESEYSLFGNCIHRGLADIYGQVFGIEGENLKNEKVG